MIPIVSDRPVSEMFSALAPFFAAARSPERIGEYRDHGQADLEFTTRMTFEMFFWLLQENDAARARVAELEARVAELEALLKG
jgi:hypothetical protein